jgi:uncharacterized protein YbjT (DUF2867 family)
MRVLVVGATGLIGGTIVARLIEAGCEVVGIARRTQQRPVVSPPRSG